MSYPSRYYQMQRTVLADIGFSQRTGLCPVCKQRKSATWPDGVRRITCGADACYRHWLPGRIDARDSQLRNANDYINRQREQMRQLASEKPMTFGGVPMYHAAHLHKSCDNRQLWLMWDN